MIALRGSQPFCSCIVNALCPSVQAAKMAAHTFGKEPAMLLAQAIRAPRRSASAELPATCTMDLVLKFFANLF